MGVFSHIIAWFIVGSLLLYLLSPALFEWLLCLPDWFSWRRRVRRLKQHRWRRLCRAGRLQSLRPCDRHLSAFYRLHRRYYRWNWRM